MADTFDAYYVQEPWSAIDIKERDWYVPELQWAFRKGSNYSQLVPLRVDFGAVKTKKMIWTGLWGLEPNINPIDDRSIWLPTMTPDGFQIEMTLHSYGGKIALHKYDERVAFFTSQGRNAAVLAGLCHDLMRQSVVDHLEKQIRNAFLGLPVRYIAGGGTGFSDIGSTDLYDPAVGMDVSLEFAYNEVQDPNNPNGINAVAYASPGQIYSAQQNSDYKGVAQYSEIGAQSLLRYEMGAYKGVRYLQTGLNTLWNCGAITNQTTVTAAINAGDGAPDPATVKVLGAYKVGQKSGPTRYITVDDASGFSVGDMVSIHTLRSDGATAPYDISNAPLPTDGTKFDRQIHSIDTGNNRIAFTKPLMMDYTTDLGEGVYAYVTKGLHIHAAVIVAGPGAVVGGFAQPPKVMFPPAIDDRLAMYRVSWDSVHEYDLFRPEMAVVLFSAGYGSVAGVKQLGN